MKDMMKDMAQMQKDCDKGGGKPAAGHEPAHQGKRGPQMGGAKAPSKK